MPKEVQMTFRIEPELRADFIAAALQEHRPAAQILREFMRAYVNQSREPVPSPTNDAISSVESRCREAAVSFARSSVGLEGYKPSKAAETDARQFIKGDILLAEFLQVKPDAEQAHNC